MYKKDLALNNLQGLISHKTTTQLYISNILLCLIQFIFSFLPFYSVLIYHGYINANIGLWLAEIWVNIFSTTKGSNYCFKKSYM